MKTSSQIREKTVIQKIYLALLEVFWSYSPQRSFYESMMKIDFKLGDKRQNLMQLCFSQLASWPILFVGLFVYFDPTKHNWNLQKFLLSWLGSENSFSYFLLDGRLEPMLIVFALFFVLEWIVRAENWLISIVLLMASRSDIHFHLAFSAIFAIYLARNGYLWWFGVDLTSESQKIWQQITRLLLFNWLVVLALNLYLLQQLHLNRYFSASASENRLEFLFLVLILNVFFGQFLLSIWGHFYFQKKSDPSELPTYYSTTQWILRFKMSFRLNNQLKTLVQKQIEHHESSLQHLLEVSDLGRGIKLNDLQKVLNSELTSLKLAASRLTVQ